LRRQTADFFFGAMHEPKIRADLRQSGSLRPKDTSASTLPLFQALGGANDGSRRHRHPVAAVSRDAMQDSLHKQTAGVSYREKFSR
jgi:hypothetical protein